MAALEIPANEVRRATHTIGRSVLGTFIELAFASPNVVSVEVVPQSANFQVTVGYAVMDLALQLNAISTEIEKIAKGVRTLV